MKPFALLVEKLDSSLRASLLVMVVGVPLLVAAPLYDPYSLPKLALLLGGIGTSCGIVAARSLLGRPLRHWRPVAVPGLALCLPLAVSWLVSPHRSWTLLGSYLRYTGVLPYVCVAVLGIFLVDAFWGRPRPLAWALSLAGGVAGTYAFAQALGLDPLWSPGRGGGSEYPPSTIGHFNFLGGFLAISLPLSIYLWVGATRAIPRIAATWAAIATVIGLLLANSQGGWAAALAGLAIVTGAFASSRWSRARVAGMLVATFICIGIVGAVVLSLFLPDAPALGGTVRERGRLWGTALEMGADAPVVGHGPSAYALEGVRYRPLASVLSERHAKADDPHSVPMSFWSNAGAVGATGFIVFVLWVVVMGSRMARGDHLSMAFFAAVAAYIVQSTVSIDLLPLRTGLWTALAGLVISSSVARGSALDRETELLTTRPTPSAARVAVATMAAFAVGGTSLWYAANLVAADRRVQVGQELFAEGEVDPAVSQLRRATSFRFEPRYLNLFGEELGTAALNRGEEGAALIRKMRDVYAYLYDFPETYGILSQARTLHYWAHFEPTANREALHLLEWARSLDPENPEIDIQTSQVLIELGERSRARSLLEEWVPSLHDTFPSFWGALSTARLLDNDVPGAVEALREGLRLGPGNCHVRIAETLIERYRDDDWELHPDQSFAFQINCGQGEFLYLSALLTQVNDT